MVLEREQKTQLNRMLKKQSYWNVITTLDGVDNSYPKYTEIAKKVGCEPDEVKEYKDMFFSSRTPGV